MIAPRGAVTAAAGVDLADCQFRNVTYLTPLAAEEVMQFHYTLASRAGFNPRLYKGRDGELVLRGKRGSSELAIVAKPLPDGLVGVNIATVGSES